ncbi:MULTISPECIES: hypothetical protein [unclassified Streptomyces]|uniref:hypothetical protein n=1 Tax=unclassified Streptomyces TaxID=2593676 RepID=UPI000DDC0F6C|nr:MULTISPECIES: hypothetical protein [unclassified Streptomyces]QZZ26539.1 hypothetical protein A7X85_09975 [Streptomyces sp. ST1015]
MHTAHADDAPTCIACRRDLYTDEVGRYACRPCQDRADVALRQLPGPGGLYARLATVTAPGRGGGIGPVSGSRTAPLPIRLEPLSLSARGGVVTVLQAWLVDWHERLGWLHPRWEGGLQEQLDQVVRALRANLGWAAAEHPAFDEFLTEIARLVWQCEMAITGEKGDRRVSVVCPCGSLLGVTIHTSGVRCRACSTQYGRTEALSLPLADRNSAWTGVAA